MIYYKLTSSYELSHTRKYQLEKFIPNMITASEIDGCDVQRYYQSLSMHIPSGQMFNNHLVRKLLASQVNLNGHLLDILQFSHKSEACT